MDSFDSFTLFPDQQEAFETIIERFNKGSFYRTQLLPAATGYGKSVVGAKIAHYLHHEKNMKVMIICPSTIKIQWKRILDISNVPLEHIYTYTEIRGHKGKVFKIEYEQEVRDMASVKHEFLTRGNETIGPFETTAKFEKLCKEGLFIIIDESQALKNKTSATHWAGYALIKTAMTLEGSNTNILHLTASSIDKEDNWQSLFRIMGLITKKQLWSNSKEFSWKDFGVGTVFKFAKSVNPKKTNEIFLRHTVDAASLSNLLKDLWVNIFRPLVVVKVVDNIYVDDNNLPIPYIRKNGFYTLDEEGAELAMRAIDLLKGINIIDKKDGINVKNANDNMGLLQTALMMLANSKNKTVLRIALNDLIKYPTCKIILCITFKQDQQVLMEELKDYGVLLINGDVPFNKRNEIIDKFNEPNLDRRIIIMTPQVGGVGVNLHDTDGKYPRRMYIVPTFHFLDMFQATGRTYRRNVKSEVFVSFVYGNNTAVENVLVNAMIKSKVTSSVMQKDSGRLFPDSFENYIEDENDEHDMFRTIIDTVVVNPKNLTTQELEKLKELEPIE